MRTYKDIEVKFYDTKGDVHVRCSVPVTEDALVHFELMQSHYCKLSFKLGSAIYFKMGDFIVTDYGRFELVDNVKPKDDGTLGYSYELEFDAYYRKWKNKRLKYMPNSGSPEGTFTLTSNIITHANIIKDNLDFLAKASKSYLYDPNYTGKGSDYTFVVDASVDSTKSKVITYSNSSILDAIANIAQTFECEWWVEGNLVHFGTCENTNEVVDFKDGENIVSMSSSQSQASYANRVYAFGAARNLPSGYKQNSSADVTKNGVVEKRLMLPTLEECSAENKKLLEDNGFELKNGCLQVKGLTEDEYVEGVTTNDDIYPRNLIKTSNVTYYEKDVEDESTPEEGDYIKRTFYRVKGLTIVDADGNKTGDMAFRSSYILSGKTLHIIFQSGSLNGMDFECQFNPDGESEILRDSNGSPILKDGKEQINPAAQVFEIVANEDYGRFLPDTVLHPKDGDTFVLYNWDSTKLGNTLVTSSANELLTDAIKNLKKSMIDPTTYTCTAASDYSYNDGKGQFHFEGDRVNLFNKGYDMSFRASRIIGYELHLDVPFDSVKYTVGEKPAYSRLNAMSSQIEELVFNGQSYLNKGGSGNSIYIIKSYDTTVQPTDFNVFSAKRVENSYLHKDKTDAANFLIKFLRGLQVGDYSALSGGDWSLDELFRSHLTTDYLNVRMKAIFETLEILHTDTLGGELFITTVGSNRILKVEEVNVTYDGVSQNAYRCYFLGEQDGSKVENKWKVGDQARSKSFNLTQGKFHNVGNHYYWRLVIGVSTETVEIEGKNYHYVDLSDIDKDTSSDIPMVDDVLNQVGSRTDIARQSCLVFSAVDTYSPSVTLYHGVNGYTFNNKEYVDYGVNHSTGKAFFHVYGDMYFGDRPTSANNYEGESYVKFDSETKKVTIKGDLDIKSTYDGKTLDKYITEKSLDKNAVETIIQKSQTIIDLQNQIDGAIETWFYDGVPTLKNAPAISWKTDTDKETHLGDLYYDNKTGKAYRFAKDGSTYEWIIITDTELTKALKDSSQALKDAAAADKKAEGAQDTANTKRRIFGLQPVPPYDVNDMWVNATYPNDGSTYKNEILKCSTAKAEGEKFDIADWKLASKYTDDTVAEKAQKAAEKAQAEIKTTQSNLNILGTTVTENKKTFDSYVKDGYLEPSEIAAMSQDSKRLEDAFAAAEKSYNEVKGAEVLKSTKELTDLNTAFTTLSTAKTELVTYLSDISTNYNKADTNGKAAIVSAVGTKFTNFQSAYASFYDKLGLANAYITRKIYGDLGVVIGDVATYQYLKKVLADGVETEINGGLILTSLIALRDPETKRVESGINGVIDKTAKGNGIATWWGGYMNDGEVVGFDKKEDYSKQAATSLIRFDGSGYLANGAIWWDVSGKVHADPTSFIISEKNLGAYLTFFEPTWKEGSAGTSVADLVSLKPNAPFSKLGVSGDATFEGTISFHGIKLTYDSKNKAIKIDGNLYTTGGITAYGAGASTTGGGGLIASVISYARIIEGNYTDADLTSIPNAYAIKALSSRIDNIASELGGLSLSWNNITGKPSTFTPSAHTHKWADITDRITKVSQLTNDKGYLTAHQSLASYYTKAEIDAKGYTTNKGTVTSVALTLPTGLTCATKTITTSGTFAISLASGYSIPTTAKQTAWDGAVSAKHTHSNKSVLDGITSTKVTCWDSAYDWYALITTDEETADGVINKWNEVVSFLANIAQTDTLSGIVDGINKSISDEVTRAKKAEGVNASGISTNKTSITTLQGYFTSGSAKKALQLTNTHKLWGNSFNGTADINGSIIVPDGKYISIGNIKMEYDATNKALKITNTTTNEVANLYTSGGVSAYGVGTSSSSGGGLNGSVKSYSNALKLTSESLSEIASAYSIKALDSRISSLEGGSATAISVSGSGNAVTSVTKNGTTISVVKGSTFLTSHQSLDGYVNAISVSGSGNAITSVSKSGKSITFTKGATFLTSHQSLANYYTKSSVDSLLSGKSATSHTHSVKINGVTKTIAATGGTAVDLGTYLTSHQSLADYAKKSEIPTKVSQLTNDTGYITSSGSCAYATNADKVDGVHVTWAGELTSTTYLAAWEANGSALRAIKPSNVSVGNADKLDGIHANGLLTALSNSDKGISITVGGTTKSVSNISVNYASSAGNADTVDGYHASHLLVKRGRLGAYNIDKETTFGTRDIQPESEVTISGKRPFNGWGTLLVIGSIDGASNHQLAFTGDNRMFIRCAYGTSNNYNTKDWATVALTSDNVASATKLQTPRTIWGQSFDGTGNVSGFMKNVRGLIHGNSLNEDWSDGNNTHPWYGIDYRHCVDSTETGKSYTSISSYFGLYFKTGGSRFIFDGGDVGIGTNSPAYKLHVVGNIYSTASIRTAAQNQAIMLNNDASPAWISALEGQVIFNTGKAIRFGETAWDWNQWAGLKYNHSDKTIYLGIADNSVFNANSAQSNGTLKFPGITTITPDGGARIGGSGGNLYLGNANNTGWVCVQDMCSQVSSSYWSIRQTGSATFKTLTVNDVISCDSISVSKNAVIAGNLSVNGLINNKGILPTNYEVNNKGAGCYVSADALCSGITAITDSIPVTNVDIHYSNDNGANWTRYEMSDNNKFKLYANVPENYSINLGNNVITGNNDAEKLAQVKKNQLMFTFEVLNNCYSQIYFASVDMSNGINTICTVEFIDSKGVIINTFTKFMTGWNQFNYINLSNGNEGFPVGNNNRRYIRFKFKHDQNTTALRNTSINRIRIFAFTKYSFPTDRFMGHTGHIYNFDYNMNTYFPNSILAKGGVTAYQSSDIRLKQDLRKLDYLGIIKAMGGTYGFAWKKDNTRSIGWIAQHVLHNPHLKDIVETDEKGYYKINYWSPKLIATAFGAIEQVGDEVSRLKARVVFLESEVLRLSGDKEDSNKKRLDNKNINLLN